MPEESDRILHQIDEIEDLRIAVNEQKYRGNTVFTEALRRASGALFDARQALSTELGRAVIKERRNYAD